MTFPDQAQGQPIRPGPSWIAAVLLILGYGQYLTVPAHAHGALHEQLVEVSAQLAAHPDDFDLLLRRGELQRLHGSWAESRADFEHARTLRTTDIEPGFRLGRLELDAGNPITAARWLEAAVAERPHHIEANLLLARAWVGQGKPGKSIPCFNTAIHWSRQPRPEWFVERSKAVLAAAPDSKEATRMALASLDEGLELVGPVPTLQLAAIELEVRLGRTDAAVKRVDAIREVSERKEQWWFRRGILLEEAGRRTEAATAFHSAVDAIERLPDRLQRTLGMVELRRDLEKHLRSPSSPPTPPPAPDTHP